MTALVIGATGLVGRALVTRLLDDSRFTEVRVFARRSLQLDHAKLDERIVDFDQPGSWQQLVTGDVLFSTLGTTLNAAGSKEAQYQVDYTYQYRFAETAARNGVPVYVLVSSAGASPRSGIFYSRIKGELERDVQALPFTHIHIIRPGILAGKRREVRTGEQIGIAISSLLAYIPFLKQYRPYHDQVVARALINAVFRRNARVNTYTLGEIFQLAGGG